MKRIVMCAVVAFGVMASGTDARAEQQGWTYSVTPYAWMAGLNGDLGLGPVVVPVDESFSDLLDNLEVAVMVGADANNGTWGMFADTMYMDLEDDGNTQIGKVSAGVEQWLVSAGGYYRVMADDKVTLDVGAGGRYIDTKLDIKTPMRTIGGSENWIDPIVVARVRYQTAMNCFLELSGDIGGFGVESDLVWQLTATAGYNFTDSVALLLGYRHLDYDYDDDGLLYDMATSGFGVGLSFQF